MSSALWLMDRKSSDNVGLASWSINSKSSDSVSSASWSIDTQSPVQHHGGSTQRIVTVSVQPHSRSVHKVQFSLMVDRYTEFSSASWSIGSKNSDCVSSVSVRPERG